MPGDTPRDRSAQNLGMRSHLGKRVFANVIKLRIWKQDHPQIIQVDPKPNDKCPYKGKTEGDWRQKTRGGHVKIEAEIGGSQLHSHMPRISWSHHKLEDTKKGSYPRAFKGNVAPLTP